MSSLLWTAIGAAIVVASTTLNVGSWHKPGSGFLPLLTGIALAVLGLGVFVQEWMEARRAGRGLIAVPAVMNLPMVGLALGALLAYALLLERGGYLPVTFVFLVLMLRFGGSLRWGPVLVTALLSTAASYALFARWLRVPLPPWPAGF